MDKILKKVLSDQFGVPSEEINSNTCIIKDLNADSIDIVEVIMNLEKAYGIAIEEGEYQDKTTVGQLLELIAQKQSK